MACGRTTPLSALSTATTRAEEPSHDVYYASMPRSLRSCTQSPITKTYCLVRSEILSLFYGTFAFELLISRLRSGSRWALRPSDEVEIFLANTTEQNCRSLRKVYNSVERAERGLDETPGDCLILCELVINPYSQTYDVKIKPSVMKKDLVSRLHACNLASEQIGVVLKSVCERQDARGLRADDIYKVRVIREELFR